MPTKIDIDAKYAKDLQIWEAARSDATMQALVDGQLLLLDQARALRDDVVQAEGQSLDIEGWDLAAQNYTNRLALYRTQPEAADQPFLYGYGEVAGQRIYTPDIQMGALLFNDMIDLAPQEPTWADAARQRVYAGLQAHYEDIAKGLSRLSTITDPVAAAYEGAARIATQAARGVEAYATGEIVARAKSRAVGTALGLGLGVTAVGVLLIAVGQGKLKLPR